MKKIICFDMDGTIADLYNVDNWLESIQAENPAPYKNASPMWDMKKLNAVLEDLREAGWEIRIITWLSMNSSERYKEAVRAAKLAWLKEYGFVFDHFHGVQYGATKADSIRKVIGDGTAILIDDNIKVREGWRLGNTIDPTAVDLLEALQELLRD